METFIFTVLGGVIIFVSGQFVIRFIFDPIQEFKKTLSAISFIALHEHAELTNAMSNTEIAIEIRKKSAEIISKSDAILGYKIVKLFFSLPSKKNILKASRELNLISFYMREEAKTIQSSLGYDAKKTDFAVENTKALNEIGKLLKLKTGYS